MERRNCPRGQKIPNAGPQSLHSLPRFKAGLWLGLVRPRLILGVVGGTSPSLCLSRRSPRTVAKESNVKPTLDYCALHASEVVQRYEVAPGLHDPSALPWTLSGYAETVRRRDYIF